MNQGVYVLLREKMREQDEKYGPFASTQEALGVCLEEWDELRDAIPRGIECRGSDSIDRKEAVLDDFSDGVAPVLITKPSIAGFGMNWQHCANMAFVGLTYSYEDYYQAIRRCWRVCTRCA